MGGFSPTSEHDGLNAKTAPRFVRIAPIPLGIEPSDRTLGLLAHGKAVIGLLQRASVEHSKHVSMHCALPAQHAMGG